VTILRHFYHVDADGGWTGPLREHAEALGKSGLAGIPVTVGLTGPKQDRDIARWRVTDYFRAAGIDVIEWVEADAGWEQPTLSRLRAWAKEWPDATVLYAHTQGACDSGLLNDLLRQSMTRRVILGWRDCLERIGDGYDAVGCHWLTPERDHKLPYHPVRTPQFGGNYWWARAEYLARLPEPETERRSQGADWVGQGNPKVFDLRPGWPSVDDFQAVPLSRRGSTGRHRGRTGPRTRRWRASTAKGWRPGCGRARW
jgi:hypothetical protein